MLQSRQLEGAGSDKGFGEADDEQNR